MALPVLIIQGSKDEQVSIEDAKKIYRNTKEPKYLWIVEGAKHTDSYNLNSTEYEKRIVVFFNENI